MLNTKTLKRNNDFLRTYKKGRFFVGKYIILYVLKNNTGNNRLGITASKKFGKSVQRNRIKRLIRENYRFYEEYIKQGFDIVFVARNKAEMPEFTDVKKEMKFLLKKLDIFDREKWDCLKEY